MAGELSRVETIFNDAVAIPGREERNALLARACGDDADLRRAVEALLAAHDGTQNVLRMPYAQRTLEAPVLSERPGTTIGRYKLLEQIGEGGFGVVYMAEQQHPVRRKVALKILKPGMDTKQVIARFEAERQALALMEHEHIAKVLDAGATDSGRPYFVMELVRGIPITDYCDQNKLSTKERLELFITVCSAVQHAHQKGIIHRDIKPTNVLVTLHEGIAVPKVIDFGIAKATGQQLTEKTLFTNFAQMIGTPLYMSPEQAEMTGIDVDTRSDIYSLGVLLYELLTGTTPLDKDRLRQAAFDEIRRLIREEEPPRPSTRLSTMNEKASTISAAQRKSDPRRLGRLVRGELDWIVMKALEKQRNRRYETATGLARDIERYLRDEAVEACPPSTTYRLRKFVRRNKGPVLAAAFVLLALIAGVIGTSLGLVHAQQARRAERQAKQDAEAREAESKAVLEFVQRKVFAAARPQGFGGLGQDVSLRQAMEAALPYVEESFTDRPLIEARLRMTLGGSFDYLGQLSVAEAQFERARALYTKHLGHDDPKTLNSMHMVSWSYFEFERFPEAIKLEEEVLALQKIKLGRKHPDTLTTMATLGCYYSICRRYDEALKLAEEVLALRTATLGADHVDTLHAMSDLADIYLKLNRNTEELKLREELLPLAKAKLGIDSQLTLAVIGDLAEDYGRLGQTQDALKLELELLVLSRDKLGPNHEDTLICMGCTASWLLRCERGREGIELIDEYVRRAHESGHGPNFVYSTIDQRFRYFEKLNDAMGCRTSAEMWEMFKPANEYDLYAAAGYRAVTAGVLRESGSSAATTRNAVTEADRAMEWLAKAVAADTGTNAYLKTDQNFDALRDREDFKALLAGLEAKRPPVDRAWELVTRSNASSRDPNKALALAQEAVAQAPQDDRSWNTLGAARYGTGDLEGAIAALQKSRDLALIKRKLGPERPDMLLTTTWTAHWLLQCGRASEAIDLIDECVRRAHQNGFDASLIDRSLDERLRHFQNLKDAKGCRASAEMWETFHRTTAGGLYNAGCYRAVTAGVFRAAGDSPEAIRNAATEADRAMDWLTKAVAAGYSNGFHTDKDLDTLRDREDFKALVAGLDAKRLPVDRAWGLATSANPSNRDPAKALAWAQEALAQAPQDPKSWNVMGAARYRAGDFKGAVAALQKARELGRDESSNAFFLSMAHWRAGQQDEARQCYRRGSAAMDRIATSPASLLRRLEVEAAELLGEKPTPRILDEWNGQAWNLRQQDKLQEARALRKKVVDSANALYAKGDPALVKYQCDYTELLLQMKRYDEAEAMAREALESLPPGERFTRTRLLRFMVENYKQWGKPDQEQRYRQMLERFSR